VSRNIAAAKNYFQSPALFYVFVLQYTDGTVRQRLLGITERHYQSLQLAQVWNNNISQELTAVERIVGTDSATDAREVLLRLYEGMTKNGK